MLTTLLGELTAVPWRRPHAVPSGTVLSTWRTAIGEAPLQQLQRELLAAVGAEHREFARAGAAPALRTVSGGEGPRLGDHRAHGRSGGHRLTLLGSRAVVDSAAERLWMRTLLPNEAVYRAGDPGDAMFVVASGRIAVRLSSPDGDAVEMAAVHSGTLFGYLELFDGGCRSADAVAVAPSRVVVVGAAAAGRLFEASPELVLTLAREMARVVRGQLDTAQERLFYPVAARLARFLLAAAGPGDRIVIEAPGVAGAATRHSATDVEPDPAPPRHGRAGGDRPERAGGHGPRPAPPRDGDGGPGPAERRRAPSVRASPAQARAGRAPRGPNDREPSRERGRPVSAAGIAGP